MYAILKQPVYNNQYTIYPIQWNTTSAKIFTLDHHTIHTLFPYKSTRHYLPPLFPTPLCRHSKLINPEQFFYQRRMIHPEESSLDHDFILISIKITPNHWTILVRVDKRNHTNFLSHDSEQIPIDRTTFEHRLTECDSTNALAYWTRSVTSHHSLCTNTAQKCHMKLWRSYPHYSLNPLESKMMIVPSGYDYQKF